MINFYVTPNVLIKRSGTRRNHLAQTVPFSIITTISGRYGDRVYVTRGGKTHARPYVVPRNPRSGAQQARRGLFAEAVRSWQGLDAARKALWNRRARQYRHRSTSGYHLYLGAVLRGKVPPVPLSRPPRHGYSSVLTPPWVRFDTAIPRMPLRERPAYPEDRPRAA